MLAEQQRRSLSDDVQYLTDRQLEQLVEQTPDNDIKDYEDLQSGEWGAGGGEGRSGPGGLPPAQACLRMAGKALQVFVIRGPQKKLSGAGTCAKLEPMRGGDQRPGAPQLAVLDQHVGKTYETGRPTRLKGHPCWEPWSLS